MKNEMSANKMFAEAKKLGKGKLISPEKKAEKEILKA